MADAPAPGSSGGSPSPAGAEPCVVYEAGGRIARLRLNRPAQRNALSAQLLTDFHRALDAFDADDEARVAILSGNGPSFCAGFDLGRASGSTGSTLGDPWADRRRLRRWIELCLRLWEFPRPVVAQVHGHCLAGGILLPLCSDIVFTSQTCVFGWPRLPMGAGLMDAAMSLVVGQHRAKQISYVVGSRITGTEAERWGFVNAAVPAAELEDATLQYCRQVARTPRSVLEMRKAAITRANSNLGFREALLAGVEWDAIAHVDPAVDEYRGLVREYGMARVIEAFESSDDPARALAGDNAGGR
jgi:enoyl-CoA hydratase